MATDQLPRRPYLPPSVQEYVCALEARLAEIHRWTMLLEPEGARVYPDDRLAKIRTLSEDVPNPGQLKPDGTPLVQEGRQDRIHG